jgi:muramoyltetrapeptide carboxypeptidase
VARAELPQIRVGPALVAGGAVSLIAPSSPFDREKFERGVAALRSLSLEPRGRDDLFSRWPESEHAFLAGDDSRRLAELRAALEDPASRLLVMARGGYGALRIAARLPLEEIARAGKLLLGYSDATVLHQRWAQAGVPSIHGPMCTQLADSQQALTRLAALLFGDPVQPIAWDPIDLGKPAPGRAAEPVEGTLRGGNLATLASLCGTELAPDFANCIVLLEDLAEPPYRLDRLCTQLLQSGAFEGARGFVIGDLWGPDESSEGRGEVLAERLGALGVPLAFGAPFGHAGRNQPVAFGCLHRLDARAGSLTPLESPTAANS